MVKMKKTIILFSSGKESIYNLYRAIEDRRDVVLVHYDYGQLAADMERTGLRYYAHTMSVRYTYEFKIPLISNEAITHGKNVNDTVHLRNLVFVTHAANIAMNIGADEICIGCNKFTHNRRGDNSQHFIREYGKVIKFYTNNKVELTSYTQHFRMEEVHKELIAEGMDITRLWMCESDGSHNLNDGQYIPRHCGKCYKCKTFLAPPRDKSPETKTFIDKLF